MTFQQFLAKWTNPAGQRVDYDHVFSYQCVDLALQYAYECFGIKSAYGNAIDWWYKTSPNLLPKFTRIQTNSVAAGDIVVLASGTLGHIGVATGNQNATQFEMLEQNGSTGNGSGVGGDAIRTRWIDRSRIVGLLRPAVVSTPPPVPMITIDQLNSLYMLNLNRAPDQSGVDHYVGHYTYDFVNADLQNSAEYKIIHTPKPVVIETPAPAPTPEPTPAPEPVIVKSTTPLPPMPIPGSTEKYYVVKSLKVYSSWLNANAHTNSNGTIAPGAYFIFNQLNGMYSLTKTPGQSAATWINPADNVIDQVPVAPAPTIQIADITNDWRKTYVAFANGNVKYKALQNLFILDIAGLDKDGGIRVKEGDIVPMHGSFIRNNMEYLLCRLASDTKNEHWYGVPTNDPEVGSPCMIAEDATEIEKQRSLEERDYRRSQGHMTTDDRLYYFQQLIARFVNDGGRFVDGIIPMKKLKAFFKGEDKK